MPYLDNQIPLEDHKEDCTNPKAIRLSRRGYDKRGNQVWIAWGLECPSCGVVIKQPYKLNPTRKQQDKQLVITPKLPKLLSEKTTIDSTPRSKEEIENEHKKRLKEMKMRAIKRRKALNPITPLEAKYHKKIKALSLIYKKDCKLCPGLRGKKIWDEKLVNRYLTTSPEVNEMHEILYWPPLYRTNARYANKWRGHIPDPEHRGYWKWDPEYLKTVPSRFNHHYEPITVYDPTKPWEFEKLVLEEASGRMEAMSSAIRKHEMTKIKVKITIPDEK